MNGMCQLPHTICYCSWPVSDSPRATSGRPSINIYKWPSPSISGTMSAQFAEGLHYIYNSQRVFCHCRERLYKSCDGGRGDEVERVLEGRVTQEDRTALANYKSKVSPLRRMAY